MCTASEDYALFFNVCLVVFKVGHHHGVVDMVNRYVLLHQSLAKYDVFVAALLKALVKRTAQHDVACYQEVRRTETVIGLSRTTLCCMLPFTMLFIEEAQIAHRPLANADAAIDDVSLFVCQIAQQEMAIFDGHVAIHEQQPVILAPFSQKVPGCSTARILLLFYILAVRNVVDGTICCHTFSAC